MSTREIFNRIGTIIGSQANKKIAEALGVAPQATSGWKERNSIPWKHLYEFSRLRGISLKWLISGQEEDILPKGYYSMPHYEFSVGNGKVKRKVVSRFVWKEDWLRAKFGGINFGTTTVPGAWMDPFIKEGDLILLDMSPIAANEIVNGKIYTFAHTPVILTGRLFWKGQELWAAFDNPMCPEQMLNTKTFQVIGKAIQVIHDL
jgi:hypothetical protein